jgi:protein SCO1/2
MSMDRRSLLASLLPGTAPGGLALTAAAFLSEGRRAGAAAPARKAGPRAGYFPNLELRTHDGRTVRFYDDLIHHKTVLINMMYARCDGKCPRTTANLVDVQKLLGARAGRDVHMYSITLDPEADSPEALREYAELYGAGPGWTFLTGAKADVETLRLKLGFRDPDPKLDKDRSNHAGVVVYGNEAIDRWAACPALGKPKDIVNLIDWMNRVKLPDYQGINRPRRSEA